MRSLLSALHDSMSFQSRQRPAAVAQARPLPRSEPLSEFSSPPVPNSGWASENFMFGAGMVIIQPSSHKIVVIYDTRDKYWFLPRGRKDMGESLEATAIREAYEESGYQAEFFPLYTPSHAPAPPNDRSIYERPNTEPFYITLTSWSPGRGNRKSGGEYLTSWYIGQIPEDAVHTRGTGMPNEQTYTSHLCTYEEAMELVYSGQRNVLRYAWAVYTHTLEIQENQRYQDQPSASNSPKDTPNQAPVGVQQ
ncbi:hypothetical protein D9615_007919 [Tricholomella constricta]|uniref:Nudix hydrolase domain-containing protein n=1 Tax=Tricholomella constricta TaxID=117010 RepID=A0A8H5H2K1_9AGAR|nr:hypothetical protein D9615_007919 [Tricholomella constricta]